MSWVKDTHLKLMVVDSANSHLDSEIVNDPKKERVMVAVVPKGCTMYAQISDVSFFFCFQELL